jgi:hypothetical protein
MIIMLVTDHTVDLCLAGSRKVPSLGTTRTLHTRCIPGLNLAILHLLHHHILTVKHLLLISVSLLRPQSTMPTARTAPVHGLPMVALPFLVIPSATALQAPTTSSDVAAHTSAPTKTAPSINRPRPPPAFE